MEKLVLASGSPRRRELLGRMGLGGFQIVVPRVEETLVPGLPPEKQVERLSAQKAAAAQALVEEGSLIIAADTVVSLSGAILGKPRDRAEAGQMLSSLSGKRHQVYTGLTVKQGERVVTTHVCTEVEFRTLSYKEIDRYLDTGECMDKAGAYGIQGYGALLIQGIVGDYFNVVGLPIAALSRILLGFGVDCLALAARQEEPA